MNKVAFIASLLAWTLFSSACTGGDKAAVPRPRAFPRIPLYEQVYRTDTVSGTVLTLNSGTELEHPADNQLTVSYPAYGIKLYITVLNPEPERMEGLISGRMQRMELDMGTDFTLETAENESYQRHLGMARSVLTPTPYEFLVCGPGNTLVWGAASWSGVPENADSVAPVARAVLADIRRLINDL